MATSTNYELAGEVKIGQVGIANLRVKTFDVAQLAAEMRDRVQRAPKLFERTAVVVDFGQLRELPSTEQAAALLQALREAGVRPVALGYGSPENEALAQALDVPVLAKFRAQYEPDAGLSPAPAPAPAPVAAPEPEPAPAAPARSAGDEAPGMMLSVPVRSGQQIYAEGRDLTVLTAVGGGAEVIADGSIHIYGALRGRALAGAQGFEKARIFCREFHAELVAVAGHYKVMDDLPSHLQGKAVQIWLEHGELRVEALS